MVKEKKIRHTRAEVIERTTHEFEQLDKLIRGLSDKAWATSLHHSAGKDPWTIKDAVAHVTHWKADTVRFIRGQRRPPEERHKTTIQANHLVYERWKDKSPKEVYRFHQETQADALKALNETPEEFFSSRERRESWPVDLAYHVMEHRIKEIQSVLEKKKK